MRTAYLLTILLLMCAGSASAFESYEHQKMGDLAIQVVKTICTEDDNNADKNNRLCADNWQAAVNQLVPCADATCMHEDRVTYGDIVRCVDGFLVPEQMLSRKSDVQKQGHAGQFWLPSSRIELGLDAYSSASCGASAQDGMYAAHANHTHFQDDLLVALNLNHAAAIGYSLKTQSSAEQEKNTRLYGALVMNAIADHYLQDFFAPGHMVTPRNRLTDTASNSMHDLANDQGLTYYLDPGLTAKLINNPVEAAALKKAFAAVAEQLVCQPSRKPHQASPACSAEELSRSKDVARILDWILDSTPGRTIELKGDNRLWRNADQGLEQRVLMLAVNVQSILDVIRANKTEKYVDSFDKVNWVYAPEAVRGVQLTGSTLPANDNNQYVNDSFGFGEGHYEFNVDGKSMRRTTKQGEYQNGTFSTLIGFQYARESFATGTSSGRNAFEIYAAPWLYMPGERNIIPSIGYVSLHEGSFGAHGAALRLAVTVPGLEFTLSPYLRAIKYPNQNAYEWKYSGGLRLEQGFTSFLTIFVGLGKDCEPTSNLGLKYGWVLTTGINISMPYIRAKNTLLDLTSGKQ